METGSFLTLWSQGSLIRNIMSLLFQHREDDILTNRKHKEFA